LIIDLIRQFAFKYRLPVIIFFWLAGTWMFLPFDFLITLSRLTSLINFIMLGKDDLQVRWWKLEEKLMERFGKKPDVESVLFMIGIQELGDIQEKFTKEQKQDLMHIAVCTLLMPSGYYELSHVDEEGWPHFKQLKPMPDMDPFVQENFLKDHILLYFQNQGFLD
jgi:hypothetical protein